MSARPSLLAAIEMFEPRGQASMSAMVAAELVCVDAAGGLVVDIHRAGEGQGVLTAERYGDGCGDVTPCAEGVDDRASPADGFDQAVGSDEPSRQEVSCRRDARPLIK